MSDRRGVSRRESLRNLGAVGAALALGGAAPTLLDAQAQAVQGAKAEQPAAVVDLAVGRMAKGHS